MNLIAQCIPSILTLGNLFMGMLAMVSCMEATESGFVRAAWFIIAAAIFDVLDGKASRMLKTSSDFGVELDSIVDVASSWGTPHWFLLVLGLVIFIGAVGTVYGSSMLPYSSEATGQDFNITGTGETGTTTDTGDFNSNVGRVIFHPKTIGMVFIMAVGALAIRLLATAQS